MPPINAAGGAANAEEIAEYMRYFAENTFVGGENGSKSIAATDTTSNSMPDIFKILLIGNYVLITVHPVLYLPLYFIPTLIAFVRYHHRPTAFFLTNVLVGWTVIGWFAAIIWAFVGRTTPPPTNHN